MSATSRMEIVVRLRAAKGYVEAEYTVRGEWVEVVTFYGTGEIETNGRIPLAEFQRVIEDVGTRALPARVTP